MTVEHRILQVADKFLLQYRQRNFFSDTGWTTYAGEMPGGVLLDWEYDSVDILIAKNRDNLKKGELIPILQGVSVH